MIGIERASEAPRAVQMTRVQRGVDLAPEEAEALAHHVEPPSDEEGPSGPAQRPLTAPPGYQPERRTRPNGRVDTEWVAPDGTRLRSRPEAWKHYTKTVESSGSAYVRHRAEASELGTAGSVAGASIDGYEPYDGADADVAAAVSALDSGSPPSAAAPVAAPAAPAPRHLGAPTPSDAVPPEIVSSAAAAPGGSQSVSSLADIVPFHERASLRRAPKRRLS